MSILDSNAEERFDRITRLAKRIFDVDIALITLVDHDRQWFLSRQGLERPETHRDISFCGHAIADTGVFTIEDASVDPRFADNPLVLDDPRIRFYAGQPIRGPKGALLGTLCIIDGNTRQLSAIDAESLRDLAQVVETEIAAAHLATLDALTGLSNRRGFDVIAGKAVAICRRTGDPVTLLYADLSGLKQINDVHGHAGGDRAIAAFGGLLQASFRESDVVARMGGDEYAVLMTGAATAAGGIAHLRAALAEWNDASVEPFTLAAGIGSATIEPANGQGLDDLLALADASMYEDKRQG